jgi:protein-disulfide isomerase
MFKLKKAQLNFLILSLFIIVLVIIVLFMYNNKNKQLNNLEADNADELREQNQKNIIKAQSYKAQSLRGVDDSDVYIGDLNADIEVIVYEDYSNTFSAKYMESLDNLLNEYGDEVVLAFRPFSVSNNGLSSQANQALYCSKDQDKYLDFREEVFKRLNDSNLYKQDLYTIAGDLGLNEEQFFDCLKTNEYLAKVNSISKEANDFGVFGSPTTFVGSELVIGARKWEDAIDSNSEQVDGLKTVVERHLAK